MKAVIDTSVWISALISVDSSARELLRMVFAKRVFPQMSATLFVEYESVMQREEIRTRIPLKDDETKELFSAYLSMCRWNNIYYTWRPNLKDEGDDFLVELAVASGAEAIVTYNTKDFQDTELLFEYRVLTPERIVKELL